VSKAFYNMKGNFPKVTVPWLWVQSLIHVIIQLNINHIVSIRLIEGRVLIWTMLLACCICSRSCLTKLTLLALLSCIFQLDGVVGWCNRLIFYHLVAFSLDSNIVVLTIFTWRGPRSIYTSIQKATSHLFSTKVANTIKKRVVNTVHHVKIFSGSYFNCCIFERDQYWYPQILFLFLFLFIYHFWT